MTADLENDEDQAQWRDFWTRFLDYVEAAVDATRRSASIAS
jgi:hypothetical protein